MTILFLPIKNMGSRFLNEEEEQPQRQNINHLIRSASYDSTNRKVVLFKHDNTTQDVDISTFTDHDTDIGDLQSTTTSQATTLTNHTNSLATHATDIGNLQSTTTAQGNTLTNHTNSLATHATDIGNLQTTSTAQGATLSNHTNSLATHATDIGNLQTTSSSQATTLSNHATQIGGLFKSVVVNSSDELVFTKEDNSTFPAVQLPTTDLTTVEADILALENAGCDNNC